MASKVKKDFKEPIAEINIVPFVDIILVVLIIFMVTAPLVTKPSIDINLPKAASASEAPKSQLNVVIGANKELALNGVAISLIDLAKKAAEVLQTAPDTQAIISADKLVAHGAVVEVIDLIKSSGIKRFAITVNKKSESTKTP